MILNMHIRKDYQKWYIPPYSVESTRVWTMCGKKTVVTMAGIPTITSNPVGVSNTGEFGWCLECCDAMLREMTFIYEHVNLHPRVKHLYLEAMRETARQLIIATSNSGHTI